MKTKYVHEKGQALVLIALGMIALIGITALAIDGGNAFAHRRHAQNAADTAVLAAALEKAQDKDWQKAGLDRASSNGFIDPQNNPNVNSPESTVDVVVNSPPTSGPYAGNSQYVQVTIKSSIDTFFASIVGVDHTSTMVTAIAKAQRDVTEAMFKGQAIVGLAPTGCGAVKSGGNTITSINGSGIFVNSNDPNCAYQHTGSKGKLQVPSGIQIVGGPHKSNLDKVEGPISTGYGQYPFPPTYEVPKPSCTTNGKIETVDKETIKLIPGSWGSFPPNPGKGIKKFILDPGTYCVNGNLSVEGSIHIDGKSGVFFYVNNGVFSFNGSGNIEFYAPDSGPYAGLLIYVDPMGYPGYPSSPSPTTCRINGNSKSIWKGLIYAPYCNILVNGTEGTDGVNSQIIGYTVYLTGDSDTKIKYNDSENYDGNIPAHIELSE